MWMILPICCLAMLHIAGDHVAVIPDLAGILANKEVYVSTLYVFIILGLLFSTILVWVGVKTGEELVVVMKELYGLRGKKILAFVILSVCIPASALTGGYYASQILHSLTGISPFFASFICLSLFSVLAAGYGRCLLILSNYIGLLLVPLVLIFLILFEFKLDIVMPRLSSVNWLLALGLLSYNVGGMWSILVVEMGAYLSQKGHRAISLILLAKSVEGVFTILIAYLVLAANISGPLALTGIVSKVGGTVMVFTFNIILFCTFTNTMVPAMLVNARQVSSIIQLSFLPALTLAGIIISLVSCMNFITILWIMSYSGFIMIIFIIYTAYLVHKYKKNQQ
ncbi:hypothetical protein [Pelosinus propionicus]|uniref:Uncharacterized protein n=1 Tax=Pelosinus propionicus DSM 13327 TaxID=1123291 RepID=A0A1I4KTA9_9FIRM|nr:hypothetical protein [Pelosinus propionicus]SFL81853.1 hypothetical protein SAMN04490355_101989 [Pelosinus propionicus DSM 13327]